MVTEEDPQPPRNARILIISRSFAPREGGAERQLRLVARELGREGFTVRVITESLHGEKSRQQITENVCVARVGLGTRFAPLAQMSFAISAFFRGLWWRPQIIITSQLGAASFVGGCIARALRRAHFVRLTGGGTARHRSEPIAKASTFRGRLLCSAFDRPSTTILAPAKHLLGDFAQAFPRSRAPLMHVPNGVVITAASRERSRDVVWYSRGGSERSQDDFFAIARNAPDIQFSSIGRTLPASRPSNVQDLGWVSTPEVVISEHRVLLNTSPREGMPNTVLQALAMGCRVIGFDNPGMREIRDRYGTSVTLVSPSRLDDALAALQHAVAAPPPPLPDVDTVEEVTAQWVATIRHALTAQR